MNAVKNLTIGLGEYVVGRPSDTNEDWIIYGLGSCIGLIMSDPEERVAAMAHILLPKSPDGKSRAYQSAKYADTAVALLLDGLQLEGASLNRIVAQIAGGAKILQLSALGDIGQQNLTSVRESLSDLGIPIVAQSVGGAVGRTLRWKQASGIAIVKQIGTQDLVLTPEPFRYR